MLGDRKKICFNRNGEKMVVLNVNGKKHMLDVEPEMPLLWALRDELKLTGTKYSCGVAACGACTVKINGNAVRSCVFPVSAAENQEITTIEGLSADGKSHPLQKAWVKLQVPQCGYCQSGMLMTAAVLLEKSSNPSDQQINQAMQNICRCGTYVRVKKAIRMASEEA